MGLSYCEYSKGETHLSNPVSDAFAETEKHYSYSIQGSENYLQYFVKSTMQPVLITHPPKSNTKLAKNAATKLFSPFSG